MEENIYLQQIQWFPGHMAKTRRLIKENLKLVDLILEITDARIPRSSRNPELKELIEAKPRLIMLNKSDYADPNRTKAWLDYYKENNIPAFACDCKTGNGTNRFIPIVKEVLSNLLASRKEKGMTKAIRVMVVGVPNVGKSTFINKIAGAKRAKAENRPGVTKTKQWIPTGKEVELLDMPGVLWPKFDSYEIGEKLAFTGAIKDDILDIEMLSARLLLFLAENYPKALLDRFKLTKEDTENAEAISLLEKAGRKRGMLIYGGEVDFERASKTVIDEYRSGKLGRITFELP